MAVVFALGLFSVLVFNLTNTVREEHYWHKLLSPYFSYMANQQQADMLVEQLPRGLQISEFKDESITGRIASRLKAGGIVVQLDEQIDVQAYLPNVPLESGAYGELADEGLLLHLVSERGGDQVYEFIAWLLRAKLSEILSQVDSTSEQVESKISILQTLLDIDLKRVSLGDDFYEPFLLEGLVASNYVKVSSDNELLLYVSLSSGEVFKITLPQSFNVYSIPVILFLMIISIVAIAFLAYTFVQDFDRRIRTIETAASRISRGELEARVTSAGEEDAINRLGLSFNSMADHIQRLMYVQKEMIHAVSHELRTPVARIRFGVQMIEDCQTPESVQKQVKGIDGDIQELDELIDEILTYARLEQGGPILAFQQADVAAIVTQVVAEQSTGKPEINISYEFKKGSDIWKESEIETRYIHRSIQNLVGNAKRYADSKVKVVCSFDAETCRIDVEDDGPGIPEDQWESVFTPFARLDDSRTRSSGGYGLGLSIVRRILYWHGGQAFLGRSDMGGAKFSLVWPRKQSV